MNRHGVILGTIGCALLLLSGAARGGETLVLRVAPSPTLPTLTDALAAARAAEPGTTRVRIELLPGVHLVDESVPLGALRLPLELVAAGPGVRVVGGTLLPDPDLRPVTDAGWLARLPPASRAHVLAGTLGDGAALSGLSQRGMAVPVAPVGSELLLDGVALRVARWPDAGFAPVADVLDAGSVPRNREPDVPADQRESGPPRGGVFRPADTSRLHAWAAEPALWAHGYWFHDWADELLPVARVDPAAGAIALALPHRYGLGPAGRFAVVGALCELDTPGECWVDVASNSVLLWPPDGAPRAELLVTRTAGPLLRLDGARDLRIEGITFEGCRGSGIEGHDVERVLIERCTFRNLGTHGLVLDGRDCTVRACLFEDLGASGVRLAGGDRATLTPSGNAVLDCVLRRCGRLFRTYQPALHLSGVGQRVAHCAITDLPHAAILFEGNEHLIEANRIERVVTETGDAGAIYCGRDWTAQGTVIRGNVLRHVGVAGRRYENAIYLDDMASGIHVLGNLIADSHWGLLIGGGRDVELAGNVLLGCRLGLHFDTRGTGWMAGALADPETSTLRLRWRAMPLDREPWRSRYPTLAEYESDRMGRPVGSVVAGNVFVATPFGRVDDPQVMRVEQNLELEALDAWSPDGPLPDRVAFPDVLGFEPIDVAGAGPRTAEVGAPR